MIKKFKKNENKLNFFNSLFSWQTKTVKVIVHTIGWSAARATYYNIALLGGCLYEKKRPGYSPVNVISRGIVLSLVQFDFSYSSPIITLNFFFFFIVTFTLHVNVKNLQSPGTLS